MTSMNLRADTRDFLERSIREYDRLISQADSEIGLRREFLRDKASDILLQAEGVVLGISHFSGGFEIRDLRGERKKFYSGIRWKDIQHGVYN